MAGIRWILVNNRIGVINDLTGTLEHPSAEQIYDAVFEKGASGEEDCSPIYELPQISFSRFPIDPVLRLHGDSVDQLYAQIGFVVEQRFLAVHEAHDQYVFDNIWYPADLESVQEYLDGLRESGIDGTEPISIGKVVELRSKLPASDIDFIDDIELSSESIAADNPLRLDEIPNLQAKLYPYQRDGIAYLRTMASHGLGCILGDEMGLGKTLQAIALMQAEKNAGRGPSLVVAPATLVENWRREIANFAPQLSVIVHRGPMRAGIPAMLRPADVVITSYETMIRDELILKNIGWNLLILDEAQNIKNREAEKARVAKTFDRRVSVAMTGTPVENRLEDLWSISDFMLPGYLGDIGQFRSQYDNNLTDASVLGAVVAPLMLRRRVSEVADDLPPRLDIPQPLEMDSDLCHRYELIRTSSESNAGTASALVVVGRLRQLCAQVSFASDRTSGGGIPTPKFVRLTELLEEMFILNEKVVIFASFTKVIDEIRERLEGIWPSAWLGVIDGRTPVEERQELIDSFGQFVGPGAMILNPRAAGVGLNITAANHVVHFNPEWNPALTAQASGRVHRRTQTRPVFIHYLYYVQSIEDIIRDRSRFKSELAEEASQGSDTVMDSATLARALGISPVSLA